MTIDYKYEVAFSFLARDEQMAIHLKDLLQDRFTVFVYSESQREIAGTDGEKTFAEVFQQQSRVVVVLFRAGWGETPWTRIEETAIRNRAFENGYDFVLFVPLEMPPSVPKWLPKTQLWLGLDRWGIRGAASVIEARLQQAGAATTTETVQDRAQRIKRELDWNNDRKRLLASEEGVKLASKEALLLQGLIKSHMEGINAADAFGVKTETFGSSTFLQSASIGIAVYWTCHYINTLSESGLEVATWKGGIPRPNAFFFRDPIKLASRKFAFDLDRTNAPIWRERDQEAEYSSQMLSEEVVRMLLDEIRLREATPDIPEDEDA